jgi:hypothetical protein
LTKIRNKAIHQKNVPKNLRKTYKWNGKQVAGIILPDSAGQPTGTIKLTTINSTSVDRVQQVQNSEDATKADQVADAFKQASASLSQSVQTRTLKDGDSTIEVVDVKKRKLQRHCSDATSEDDWVAAINNSAAPGTSSGSRARQPEDTQTGDDEPASEAGQKNKARKKASVHPAPLAKPPIRKSSGSAVESPGSGGQKVFPSVQMREIASVQVLLNEADVLLGTATMQEGIKSLSEAKVRVVLKKLDKKMEAKTVQVLLYSQGSGSYDDDMDDGEMKDDLTVKGEMVYKNMQEACSKMEALGNFFQAAENSEVRDFGGTPSQLNFAMKKCIQMGIALPVYATILLVHRQFAVLREEAVEEGCTGSLVVGFLTTTVKSDAWNDYFGLWLFENKETLARQQEVLMTKYMEQLGMSTDGAGGAHGGSRAFDQFIVKLKTKLAHIVDQEAARLGKTACQT